MYSASTDRVTLPSSMSTRESSSAEMEWHSLVGFVSIRASLDSLFRQTDKQNRRNRIVFEVQYETPLLSALSSETTIKSNRIEWTVILNDITSSLPFISHFMSWIGGFSSPLSKGRKVERSVTISPMKHAHHHPSTVLWQSSMLSRLTRDGSVCTVTIIMPPEHHLRLTWTDCGIWCLQMTAAAATIVTVIDLSDTVWLLLRVNNSPSGL